MAKNTKSAVAATEVVATAPTAVALPNKPAPRWVTASGQPNAAAKSARAKVATGGKVTAPATCPATLYIAAPLSAAANMPKNCAALLVLAHRAVTGQRGVCAGVGAAVSAKTLAALALNGGMAAGYIYGSYCEGSPKHDRGQTNKLRFTALTIFGSDN